jgi:hypothetical protein
VALNVRRDTTVGRDDGGGLANARQNAIIGIGREGSQCGWVESFPGEAFIHVAMTRLMVRSLVRA